MSGYRNSPPHGEVNGKTERWIDRTGVSLQGRISAFATMSRLTRASLWIPFPLPRARSARMSPLRGWTPCGSGTLCNLTCRHRYIESAPKACDVSDRTHGRQTQGAQPTRRSSPAHSSPMTSASHSARFWRRGAVCCPSIIPIAQSSACSAAHATAA